MCLYHFVLIQFLSLNNVIAVDGISFCSKIIAIQFQVDNFTICII